MEQARWKGIAVLVLGAVLTMPAWGDSHAARTAVPGTVNYVEGAVTLDGNALNAKSVGSADIAAGQSITTARPSFC